MRLLFLLILGVYVQGQTTTFTGTTGSSTTGSAGSSTSGSSTSGSSTSGSSTSGSTTFGSSTFGSSTFGSTTFGSTTFGSSTGPSGSTTGSSGPMFILEETGSGALLFTTCDVDPVCLKTFDYEVYEDEHGYYTLGLEYGDPTCPPPPPVGVILLLSTRESSTGVVDAIIVDTSASSPVECSVVVEITAGSLNGTVPRPPDVVSPEVGQNKAVVVVDEEFVEIVEDEDSLNDYKQYVTPELSKDPDRYFFQTIREKKDSGSANLSPYDRAKYDHALVETLFVMFLSVLGDIFVVGYHLTHPPHPKFRMRWPRFLSINLHILSGCVEITCGMIAFFTTEYVAFARLMGVVGLLGHCTTSLYQTPIVFGIKKVMIPCYVFCILAHAFCCFRLLVNPESLMWLLHTFAVLHIYVWCRIFYLAFVVFGLFKENTYTVAILLAGMVLLPVLGVGMNLFAILFVMTWNIVLEVMRACCGVDIHWWGKEYSMATATTYVETEEMMKNMSREYQNRGAMAGLSSRERKAEQKEDAREFFEQLATKQEDGVLAITVNDFTRLVGDSTVAITPQRLEKLLNYVDVDNDSRITWEEFFERMWCPTESTRNTIWETDIEALTKPGDKAAVVFHMMDADDSGAITGREIQVLLREWGMPPSEAKLTLQALQLDEENEGQISLEVFENKFKALWKFVFARILHQKKKMKEDRLACGLEDSATATKSKTTTKGKKFEEEDEEAESEDFNAEESGEEESGEEASS